MNGTSGSSTWPALLLISGAAFAGGYLLKNLQEDSRQRHVSEQQESEKEEEERRQQRSRQLQRECQESMIKSDPEIFYDMVFYVSSPTSIVKGWNLKKSRGESFTQFLSNKSSSSSSPHNGYQSSTSSAPASVKDANNLNRTMNGVIVAIIGGFDKGKSMLFTKLVEIELPSGARVHTQGLSFKELQHEGKRYILIDSAGLNSPIQINQNTNSVDEKEAEEYFMQDLIFEVADLFIYVVNEITWREQVDLHRFTQRLKESKKAWKQVFVVHNFKNSIDQHELLKLWEEQVLQNYQSPTASEQSLTVIAQNPDSVYEPRSVAFLGSESINQRHFFIGNENTDSGSIHNPWSYALIRNSLSLAVAENSNFNLLDRIKLACIKYLPAYIEPKDIEVDFTPAIDNPDNLVLRPVQGYDSAVLKSKGRGTPYYWNLAGDKRDEQDHQATKYDIYRFQEHYQIQIEAPGVRADTVRVESDLSTNMLDVFFSIEEEPMHGDDRLLDKVQSRRQFGPRNVKLAIPNEFNIIKKCRKVQVQDGIIDIVLPRRDDDRDEN